MDTLIWVTISAAMAAFTSELIGLVLSRFMDESLITKILTAPLAGTALWLVGYTGWTLVILALAAGFLATASMKLINRPVAIQSVSRKRDW
jgi:hypothetical protein